MTNLTTAAGDLELSATQRAALATIDAVAVTLGRLPGGFGRILQATVGAFLSLAATTTIASTKCPYDAPPADIRADFDSDRTMYLRCLHATRHCWNMVGHSIRCPT